MLNGLQWSVVDRDGQMHPMGTRQIAEVEYESYAKIKDLPYSQSLFTCRG